MLTRIIVHLADYYRKNRADFIRQVK